MNTYPNGIGQWIEKDGLRVEVYHDGAWIVYSTSGPWRCAASADGDRAKNIEEAKQAARTKFNELQQ